MNQIDSKRVFFFNITNFVVSNFLQ